MAGYILYNGFWNPNEPPAPVRQLSDAAQRQGVRLTPIANSDVTIQIYHRVSAYPLARGDYAFFWDKDIRTGRALEASGVRLYNSSDAVALCDDKYATHLTLSRYDIPMPRTFLAPMTYLEMKPDVIEPFLQKAERELAYPMVVKECYGSMGGQVYLAHSGGVLRRRVYEMGPRPFLLQQFVGKYADRGEDYRLYVVGDQVVAAMRRKSIGDFRSNIAIGGVGEVYCPSKEEAELAIRCCRILGLHFAGVDLLHTDNGTHLVCEVNSNAYMSEIMACSGVCVADRIVTHVLEEEQAVSS